MKRKMTAMCLAAVLLSAGRKQRETGSIMTAMEIKSTTIGKRERMGSGVIWTETGSWRSTPGWTENTM